MRTPDPERQVQFLFDVQRLISDGSFVATYKFALLLALADLAVERGDDTTESLPLDTLDLAEKFVGFYWRQVLPWARYPLDLGHNFVLADARCNGGKLDRLAAFEHLERWCVRNARPDWTAALDRRTLPHDVRRTKQVARWAYAQAEHGGATVWQRGRDGLIDLDPRWRGLLLP